MNGMKLAGNLSEQVFDHHDRSFPERLQMRREVEDAWQHQGIELLLLKSAQAEADEFLRVLFTDDHQGASIPGDRATDTLEHLIEVWITRLMHHAIADSMGPTGVQRMCMEIALVAQLVCSSQDSVADFRGNGDSWSPIEHSRYGGPGYADCVSDGLDGYRHESMPDAR